MKESIPIFRMAKKHLNPSEEVAYKTTTPSIWTGVAIVAVGMAIGSKKTMAVGALMSAGNFLFLKSRTGK
ncbi:hypothetical protein BAU15_02760 [Enterococcus sp. JM4C]|uniref:hypothetical protein n=1 Tax=Candidatus Enterococcus huntleyi TaxID=1857217 RepID=UPI00137A0A41|nr:hypothetical protein [Enterococcus sp. JM4C]KAF1299582.1 hypothetical protein BAU15_02760 [Enterococcus sp. JM4C]